MSEDSTDGVDEKLNKAFDDMEKNQPRKAQPATNTFAGTLAVFLALVAIGIASYPAYEVYKTATDTDSDADQLQDQLNQLYTEQANYAGRLQSLRSELDKVESSAQLAENNLREMKTFVTGELDTVRGRLGTSAQDWVLAEVEYLVRMANQRVLMENDADSALQLLQAADQIVQEAQGLTAHSLRQALAQDIAALKAVNTIDIQGIYLELSALTSQVPGLNRTLPEYKAANVEEVVEAPGDAVDQALAFVAHAGERMSHLVDFRRGDIEVKPILPPAEAHYLRQNLILKLQIAQMALLEGNGEVYSVALTEAAHWVSDSFDEDDARTLAMGETLDRLSVVPIAVVLPDISSSLRAAREQLIDLQGSSNQ